MLRGSTRTVSFVSEPEEDETIGHDKASEDSVKEAIVRWMIYIITYALIIIGTGAIWVGLVLNDSLTHISADKIGYGSHVITHIFILCGVATIVVGYAGGCWFNAHQGLMLKVHFCLIITTILLYILVIVIVVFASTARRADDYLNECWEEYTNKNRTVDMMELQIRFFCCGINGIKDYTEGDYVLRMSCYFKFNMRGQPFQQTCSHAIKDYFHQKRNDCIIFNSVAIVLLILLWINHMQSVEFAFVGISLIMGGFYLPIDHSYMQVELVCYWTTSIRRMFVVCGIVLILAGAFGAFWYRRHIEFIYLTQMLFIVLGIIFTIVLALFITYNCHIEKAKRRVEYLWLETENDRNAFFMMQQHLKCCGKSGPEDYIDKEQFPVCHKNFNADDIKFTKGCIAAAEDFYNKKVMFTIVAMVAMIVDETKGLLLSIALYRCRVKIAAVAIRHNVTYITRRA